MLGLVPVYETSRRRHYMLREVEAHEPEPVTAADLHFRGLITRADFNQLAEAHFATLDRDNAEYRRVAFTATFDDSKEALVYAAASAFRPDVSGPGDWVFTPARLADGHTVIVNRGFVPEGRQDSGSRRDGLVSGAVDIVGVLRWPDPPSLFTPAGEPARNLWFARDSAAIAAAKGIADAAPFYVEMESPVPPGGLPHPAPVHPSLPNSHLGYAITWFGLAAMLVGVYGAWMIGRWRGRN